MADPLFLLAHAAFVIVLCGSVVLWAASRRLLEPTLVAIVAHVVIAVSIFVSAGLWAPDAQLYDRLGQIFAEDWFGFGNRTPVVTAGKEGFPSLLALIYGGIGHFPSLGIILNIALASALVVIVAGTTQALGGPVRTAAWMTALYPPFLVWGSLLLREALSWVLVALIVRALVAIAMSVERQPWWLATVVVSLGALVTIRGTAAVLVGAAALVSIAVTARNRVTPLILLVIAAVVAGPALSAVAGGLVGGYDIAAVDQTRAALSRDARSSFEVTSFSSIGGLITGLPISLARGLFGPFVWELPGVGPFVAVNGLLWLSVVVFFWLGWRRNPHRRLLLTLVLPAGAILAVLAVTSGNYGTLTRLREQVAVMIMPIAAMGYANWRAKRRLTSENRDPAPRSGPRVPRRSVA